MVESQAVGRRNQAKGASLSAGVASAPYPPDPTGHTEDTGTVLSLWGFDALCSVAICFIFILFFCYKGVLLWGRQWIFVLYNIACIWVN